MTWARSVTCGTLALLLTALACGALLSQASRFGHIREVVATDRPRISVSLVPARTHLTSLDAAQQPALNFGRPGDQTSSEVETLPASGSLGSGSEPGDDEAYLPASSLTGWPQQLGTDSRSLAGDDVTDEISIAVTWTRPQTVEAVLMIDEQGQVNRVQFPDETLELPVRQSLERHLRAWRFVPGTLFGRPVRSRLAVELVLH